MTKLPPCGNSCNGQDDFRGPSIFETPPQRAFRDTGFGVQRGFSVLHLSARQVQRLRERKELVGFNVGRRRLYFQTEIYDYLSRLERENLKHPEQSMEQ